MNLTDQLTLPDILKEDGPEFVPPSFERWLGRLQMTRTIASMGGFLFTWLLAYSSGMGWDGATIRAMIAAVALHFIAWALGLFVFGELYDIEVRSARVERLERERERNRRIEEYYRERLIAKGMINPDGTPKQDEVAGGVAEVTPLIPGGIATPPPSYGAQRAA